MKEFYIYFFIFGGAWILQSFLGWIQMRNFTKELIKLRNKGKVVIGKAKGGFYAGTVIILVLGERNIIVEGKKMQGVTVFSKMKNFTLFNNISIEDLKTKSEKMKLDRGVRKALDSLLSGV